MVVRVVLKNNEVFLFRNVYTISNVSSGSNFDYLNIYSYSITLKQFITKLIKFSDVLSYSVSNVICATNMYSLCSCSECIDCSYFDYKKLKCNIGGNKNEFKKIK